MNDIRFADLNYEERITSVDERLGNPDGRIRKLTDLVDHIGETMHILISPIADEEKVSNSYYYDWQIGSIEDMNGNIITKDTEIDVTNETKYFIYHYDDPDRAMECKDINLIPNNYNNHSVYLTLDDIRSNMVQRKLLYPSSTYLAKETDAIQLQNVRLWTTRDEIQTYYSYTITKTN